MVLMLIRQGRTIPSTTLPEEKIERDINIVYRRKNILTLVLFHG